MMKRFSLILVLAVVALVSRAGKAVTLDDILKGTYYAQRFYGDVTPLADGETYASLSNGNKTIERVSYKTGKAVATLFNLDEAKGDKPQRVAGYILSPDESKILIRANVEQIYRRSSKADYYLYSVQNKTIQCLSTNGKMQEPIFSRDGHQIAFVRDNNLHLIKLLFNNAESQVTTDGKFNEIINGLPDWVNEEEFATSRSFDFSADGKMLAWIKYDEREVPMFSMAMYRGAAPEYPQYAEYPGSYDYKYPVAGARNATVSVHTYDIKSHVTRKVDVPLDADGYIPRIKFTDNVDQLAIVTLNRHQSDLRLFMANARSGICKEILRETDEKYVAEATYEDLQFFGNNFVFISDRSGYKQLYWYSLTGQLVKQVTTGTDEVTAFYGYDPKTSTFYYQAKDGSPLRTAVFATNLKGKTVKLTSQSGSNSARFSANCRYFINEYSSINVPPVTTIINNLGKTERTIYDNAKLREAVAASDLAKKEFFTFKTSEGVELNGWIMKPANFDASRQYGLLLHQYSGPGSQSCNDAWGAGFLGAGLFETLLCDKGILVACIDGRGTGGRGAEFEKCTYLHLGVLESRDQVEAAIYLGNQAYVDKNRIGIWGWSYGGFNTLMSMSEGRPVFRAGIAIAPPTSWRYYDSVYTERYMRTPQENGSGYDESPISRASKLHGDLLVCHGLADDNVHFRNTAEYTEALVQAGKPFDMQIYTNRNHSIYGGKTREHLYNKILSFFEQRLAR